jgi:hypothetical protein
VGGGRGGKVRRIRGRNFLERTVDMCKGEGDRGKVVERRSLIERPAREDETLV